MYKVMIVDDEMIVRNAVKTLIQWEGSRFEYAGAASNGRNALDLVRNTKADIVITDIKMPEMDGLELIKELMQSSFDGEILVLSNYNDFDLVREALKLGAYDYMLKLTLKTESFMQTLEEMADKLDKRNLQFAKPLIRDNHSTEMGNRIIELLKTMDQSKWKTSADDQAEGMLSESGLCFYSFSVRWRDEEREHQNRSLQDILEKLTDGIFPSARFRLVIPINKSRSLFVIGCLTSQVAATPEEVARRLINLADMYYNLQIGIIYGEIATGVNQLAGEMRANRLTEVLLAEPESGKSNECLPNTSIREEVREVLFYLEEHYPERVAIADIAAFVGLSEPYLCQIFKSETGRSILTRLNEIRMDKACEMLKTGKYLVKQVAVDVGIPDPFYFNRLFRKHFGVSPKNVML